ncbi:MAG: MoxR family ATPase, partial [Bacteroidota bacterium]
LRHHKFSVAESGEVIAASEEEMPAIIITSNREQELPTAFKGRCIYHYIHFPDKETMGKIIEKHHPDLEENVVRTALDIFYHLRRLGLERAPTTREILNWLKYMRDIAPEEALKKIEGLAGIGALIKTQTDMERVSRMIGAGNSFGPSYN